jgi:NADH:ubiquinone oxidoreductase subunit 6 (subunit J)
MFMMVYVGGIALLFLFVVRMLSLKEDYKKNINIEYLTNIVYKIDSVYNKNLLSCIAISIGTKFDVLRIMLQKGSKNTFKNPIIRICFYYV